WSFRDRQAPAATEYARQAPPDICESGCTVQDPNQPWHPLPAPQHKCRTKRSQARLARRFSLSNRALRQQTTVVTSSCYDFVCLRELLQLRRSPSMAKKTLRNV